MWQKTKDHVSNIRRHWKLFLMLALCLLAIGKLLIANYRLSDKLYLHYGEETYTEVWNDRAICLSQLPENQPEGMSAGNKQAIKTAKDPITLP